MKILFLGDVVAKSGRECIIRQLDSLKKEYGADFTIINGENSAHGKGITTRIYQSLTDAGADVITLGNHAFAKAEIIGKEEQCPWLIRPYNLAGAKSGRPYVIRECKGKRIAVVNLLGSIFMDVSDASPLESMEKILPELEDRADIIIVDLHAEATSEKEIFFQYFKDRVTAAIGTHTHVQTADEQVKDGCAYISDAGMCGPFNSILGRDTQEVIDHMVHRTNTHYTPSEAPSMICGVLIGVNEETGRAESIVRIQKRPEE